MGFVIYRDAYALKTPRIVVADRDPRSRPGCECGGLAHVRVVFFPSVIIFRSVQPRDFDEFQTVGKFVEEILGP